MFPLAVDAELNEKGVIVPCELPQQGAAQGCDLASNPLLKLPLTPREARFICAQLLSALSYLHSQTPPIVFRDVKPDNVLIWGVAADADTGEQLATVKLTDYGTVRRVDTSDMTMGQGTREFMAPEVEEPRVAAASAATVPHKPQSGRGAASSAAAPPKPLATYDTSVDVFSVGATFYYLVTGQSPDGNTRLDWKERFGARLPYVGATAAVGGVWGGRDTKGAASDAATPAGGSLGGEDGGGVTISAAAAHDGGGGGGGGQQGTISGSVTPQPPSLFEKARQGSIGGADDRLASTAAAASSSVSAVSAVTAAMSGASLNLPDSVFSRPPLSSRGGTTSAGAAAAVAAAAKPAESIFSHYFPRGSNTRKFLEGLVHQAPPASSVAALTGAAVNGDTTPTPAATTAPSSSSANPTNARWTAVQALEFLDTAWTDKVAKEETVRRKLRASSTTSQ